MRLVGAVSLEGWDAMAMEDLPSPGGKGRRG